MPRNEEVLPSLRPRIFPPLIWTTGGFRLGPDDEAGDGAAFGVSCPKTSPLTPAATPARTAVVVPSIWRRFIRLSGAFDVSLAMLSSRAGDLIPQPPVFDYVSAAAARSGRRRRARLADRTERWSARAVPYAS